MLNIAAIRRAIDDVEQAVAMPTTGIAATGIAATGRTDAGQTLSGTLARLYGAYAQRVLELHGIFVDLDELCAEGGARDPIAG